MQEYFGVKVDTSNMTTEELKEAEKKITQMLASIKMQIRLRKMAEHKYNSQ